MDIIMEKVSKLKKNAKEYRKHAHCGAGKDLEGAVEIIESLRKSQTENGWISCSERTPEWGTTPYLVCLKNGGVFMAIFLNDGKFEEISSLGIREFAKDNPVIAWQPLPAPYEVKSDE